MLRTYLPVIASTALYVGFGIGLGLLWWAATGRTDMPWWLIVVLVAVATWISNLSEQALRAWRRNRQQQTTPSQHRKPAAR